MKKNEIIEIKIDDVSIEGRGVGKYDGAVVFVPCAAVGDELKAKVLKVKKNYAFAKIEKILVPASKRITPDCIAYPKCGGCVFRHISYKEELRIKEKYVKDCINRITGLKNINIKEIIGSKKTDAYRNKIQIPIRKEKNGEIKTGFYRAYSHDIVKTDKCKLHSELFEKIIQEIKIWMAEYNIEPYDENDCSGIIRHIYLRQAEKTGEILVCLVINSEDLKFGDKFVSRLTNKYKSIIGIILNINKSDTNVILGDVEKTIYGRNYINDTMCGVKLNISAKAFYQINHQQTEILYETIRNVLKLTGNEKILELYCGIGSIGLFLAKFVSHVVGVEIVEAAVENAKLNCKINGLKNVKFICGDSEKKFSEALDILKKIDVIIIDPPRKGCQKELIYKIFDAKPDKVVYVSCNPATLARDLKEFIEHGFIIETINPIDMFPRSGHVETVCLMSRVEGK